MHPQIDMMLTSFKTGVDNAIATANDPTQVEGLKKVYDELVALGEASGDDFAGFSMEANEKGLFTKLTEEMQKANAANIKQQADSNTRKELSKDHIVNIYKNLYEDVKKRPFMFKTVEAYEELLGLADQYDSLTDWQADIFKKGIVKKVSLAPSYDISKLRYDKTEPNEIFDRNEAKLDMESAEKARNSNEETYHSGVSGYIAQKESRCDYFIIDQIRELVGDMRSYENLKLVCMTGIYQMRPDYLLYVKLLRDDMKKRYTYLSEKFGVDWEKIVQTPRYVKAIIRYHRELNDYIWFSCDPKNLDWYKETLFNEIMTDKNIREILLTRQKTKYALIPRSDHTESYNLHNIMFKKVEEVAKDLYWAEYDLENLKKGLTIYYDMLKEQQEKGQQETRRVQREVLAETVKDEISGKLKSSLRNLF